MSRYFAEVFLFSFFSLLQKVDSDPFSTKTKKKRVILWIGAQFKSGHNYYA